MKSPGVTPGNSWWGCAVRSPNPWPYFRPKKCHFPHSFSALALRQRLCHQYGFECISNSRISISFLFIWNCNDKYIHTLPQFPPKPYPIPDQSGQSVYKFSNQKGPKIQPFGAAHTYMADIRGSPPLRDGCTPKQMRNATKINRCYLCSLSFADLSILFLIQASRRSLVTRYRLARVNRNRRNRELEKPGSE